MDIKTASAIERICELAGGQIKVAKALEVTPQAVNLWVRTGRVPPERVLALERLSNGTISRHELRPDVFGDRAA